MQRVQTHRPYHCKLYYGDKYILHLLVLRTINAINNAATIQNP